MINNSNRTYFPGLNALRFFAASLVIFHHLEQYKFWSKQESYWGNSIIDALGHKPVGLFFVLSGFLITYLLLEENKNHSKINIKRFYLKRVFRIWPLYFLIVTISLLIVPLFSSISFENIHLPETPLVSLSLILILPNLLRVIYPTLIGGNQLWSVGIEEQFYIFWPILVNRFKNNIIEFLGYFILVKISIHLGLLTVLTFYNPTWLIHFEHLYALFPVEQMAVGGLGAAFLFNKNEKVLKYLGSPKLAILSLVLLISSSLVHLKFFLVPFIEGILFMILIYQITTNKKIYKPLENRTLVNLGNISYGIYMWHTFVIAICITIMELFGVHNSILLGFSSFILTFIIAQFSYKFLESPAQQLRKYLDTNKENVILNTAPNA